MRLKKIVSNYVTNYRKERRADLAFYKDRADIADAISNIALASSGLRHPHQRRMPVATLKKAQQLLLRARLNECKSFGELLTRVANTAGRIKFVGDLAIYDFSVRVGAYLSLSPVTIYLHAGTREGAKALKLDYKTKCLPKNKFPKALQTLSCFEIEDCLCIYAEKLGAVTTRRRRRGC